MKQAYRWLRPLLAALLLLTALGANAQQAWRPFRPGLIYSFSGSGSGSAHTLQLDSAYVTATGDSAWTFRRIVKLTNNAEQSVNPFGIYRKSRNNLFGARLTWQRTPFAFTLENFAEGSAQAAIALQLRPRAAVGSTWAASTAPAITATLTSRTQQLVGGVPDSVVVITLNSGNVVRLSRTYGLLEAPQWLNTATGAPQWTQARLPMTLAQSPYNPLVLFNLQPGDEVGYSVDPPTLSPFPTFPSYFLRRILTRQQTLDSLIFTLQEQRRVTPSTGGTSQVLPVQAKRWAFSLRTGKSLQFPALPLLTGEYIAASPFSQGLLYVGRGILASTASGGCMPTGLNVGFIELFSGATGQYNTGIDASWRQEFSLTLGLGDLFTGDAWMVYYRRGVGSPLTCGNPVSFAGLLPTRAAQAASIATLHPNPAAEAAILTLAQPARLGHTLHLTDALGRTVWTRPVPIGQTTISVPLAGQPAGLYLLHLSGPDITSATWKLTHE